MPIVKNEKHCITTIIYTQFDPFSAVAISEYIISTYVEYDTDGTADTPPCVEYYRDAFKQPDTLAAVGDLIGTICKMQIAPGSNSNRELFSVEPVTTEAFLQFNYDDLHQSGATNKVS